MLSRLTCYPQHLLSSFTCYLQHLLSGLIYYPRHLLSPTHAIPTLAIPDTCYPQHLLSSFTCYPQHLLSPRHTVKQVYGYYTYSALPTLEITTFDRNYCSTTAEGSITICDCRKIGVNKLGYRNAYNIIVIIVLLIRLDAFSITFNRIG